MNLLGVDTSTVTCAACVLRSDGEAFEADPEPGALLGGPAHSQQLLPAVAAALERAEMGFGDLDAVAVGVGPGAFTGLRIGIATARAIASSRRIPLYPASSLEALAAGIEDAWPLPLIDARRGELFALPVGGGEPFAAPPEEVARMAVESARNPLAAGEGAVRFTDVLEAAGVRVAAPGSTSHVLRAHAICRLAVRGEPASPEAVTPDYRRQPDAKEQ